MSTDITVNSEERLTEARPSGEVSEGAQILRLVFAPLHKRAFGMAVGSVSGLLVFGLTAVTLLLDATEEINLALLNEYFYGYTVTWWGAVVGLAWGFVVGFVAGWFLAFCRNLTVGITLFALKTKAELRATRDFLDHI